MGVLFKLTMNYKFFYSGILQNLIKYGIIKISYTDTLWYNLYMKEQTLHFATATDVAPRQKEDFEQGAEKVRTEELIGEIAKRVATLWDDYRQVGRAGFESPETARTIAYLSERLVQKSLYYTAIGGNVSSLPPEALDEIDHAKRDLIGHVAPSTRYQ